MQKKLILLIAAVFCAAAVSAQVKYQGTIGGGYAAGVGAFGQNHVNVETVHGVRINPYLFCGVGAGIDYFPSEETFNSHYFGNVRGYLLDRRVTPYLSLDLGYALGAEDTGGLYAAPLAGVSCRVGAHYALSFGAGFQSMRLGKDSRSRTFNGLIFRAELAF